jgi:hypothetical protein
MEIDGTLSQLAKKYNTNKVDHNYTPFYERLFFDKKNCTSFFEIGISEGSSLLMWQDYFKNATIYGIDLFIPNSVLNQPRIKFNVADQSSTEQLENTIKIWDVSSFDIIIDDGGHTVKQQRTSLETLWKYVKDGGIYIIEDLHTNIDHLHDIHPHLSSKRHHLDEYPTVHEKIIHTMTNNSLQFKLNGLTDIVYFSNPKTMSLTCALFK